MTSRLPSRSLVHSQVAFNHVNKGPAWESKSHKISVLFLLILRLEFVKTFFFFAK